MTNISKPNVYAIIPARGGSKGIPRKNIVDLGGIPLLAHTVNQSLSSNWISKTFVSSEDKEIQKIASKYGADVIGRPDRFIHDNSVQEVDRLLKWTILNLEDQGHKIDIVVLLYPTSPLREISAIDQAVQMVANANFDSVLTLTEDDSYLWKVEGETVLPTNYTPAERGPRQMEKWNQWVENKAVYAFTRDLLVNTGCRLGGRIGYVKMPKWRSVDVDKLFDLKLVRFLYSSKEL